MSHSHSFLAGQLNTTAWSADTASKLLWSMARCGNGEEIQKQKHVVSHVVKEHLCHIAIQLAPFAAVLQELVRDKGRRMHELSYDGLTHLLWVPNLSLCSINCCQFNLEMMAGRTSEAVAKARIHKRSGDRQTVHTQELQLRNRRKHCGSLATHMVLSWYGWDAIYAGER